MAESYLPHDPKPRLYRIVEVSQEKLEGMKLGSDEVDIPNPRGQSDHGVHHDHDYSGHHDRPLPLYALDPGPPMCRTSTPWRKLIRTAVHVLVQRELESRS